MRLAFSSTRSAATFALLLLGLLLSPLIVGKGLLPPRREIYSSIWWANGDFPYMEQEIFREQGDIDILFVGASHIWAAFDTPYVQEQLGKRLGRPAVVRTFGWGGPGNDQLYFVTQDLLKNRKVRLLVFDDGYNETDTPHPLATRLFRLGDNAEALAGLPLSLKMPFYLASIIGMPRNLLSLTRPNLPADLNPEKKNYWEIRSHAPNLAARLGAISAQMGFRPDSLAEPDPFVSYTPPTGIQPSAVCIYDPATRTNFLSSSGTMPPMQLHFLKKFGALAQAHDCKLVLVHIPLFDEKYVTTIHEPVFWPDLQPANVTLIGIPPATLYQGLTEPDVRKLHSDPVHLNQNGQAYFTSLLTPTLLRIYEAQVKP